MPETPLQHCCRIMIVEDDPACRRLMEETLAARNRDLVLCENGAVALTCLEEIGFDVDLVISDLAMPSMDGMELLKFLARRSKDFRILVVTGSSKRETVLAALGAGAAEYLTKPLDVKQLRETVERLLADRRSGLTSQTAVHTDQRNWFQVSGPTRKEYLTRFRNLVDLLLRHEVSEKQREEILAAVYELGQNALEWGNRFTEEKRIRFGVFLLPDRVVLRFQDEGEGFEPDQVESPRDDPVGLQKRRKKGGKRPGGFGIYMVRKLADRLDFADHGRAAVYTKVLDRRQRKPGAGGDPPAPR